MNEAQSKRLKPGDEVSTKKLPPGETHVGTVVETNWAAVKIAWDDGQVGIVDHRDMAEIDREVKA